MLTIMKIANIWIIEVRDALVRRHLANAPVMQTPTKSVVENGQYIKFTFMHLFRYPGC